MFSNENIENAREFVNNVDTYIKIKLKGDLIKVYGKEKAYELILEVEKKYKSNLDINKELEKLIKERLGEV